MFEVPDTPEEVAAAELAAGRSLVNSIIEMRKAIAMMHAMETRMLATAQRLAEAQVARIPSAVSREREMPVRALAAEIGAATRESDRAVQAQMADAAGVVERFPAAFDAMAEGRIHPKHMRVISEVGRALPDGEVREEYERLVVAIAEPGRHWPAEALIDLRVDDDPEPLRELGRLLSLRGAELADARGPLSSREG